MFIANDKMLLYSDTETPSEKVTLFSSKFCWLVDTLVGRWCWEPPRAKDLSVGRDKVGPVALPPFNLRLHFFLYWTQSPIRSVLVAIQPLGEPLGTIGETKRQTQSVFFFLEPVNWSTACCIIPHWQQFYFPLAPRIVLCTDKVSFL